MFEIEELPHTCTARYLSNIPRNEVRSCSEIHEELHQKEKGAKRFGYGHILLITNTSGDYEKVNNILRERGWREMTNAPSKKHPDRNTILWVFLPQVDEIQPVPEQNNNQGCPFWKQLVTDNPRYRQESRHRQAIYRQFVHELLNTTENCLFPYTKLNPGVDAIANIVNDIRRSGLVVRAIPLSVIENQGRLVRFSPRVPPYPVYKYEGSFHVRFPTNSNRFHAYRYGFGDKWTAWRFSVIMWILFGGDL